MSAILKQQEIFQMFNDEQLTLVIETLQDIIAYRQNKRSSKTENIKLAEKLLDSQLSLIEEQEFAEQEREIINRSSQKDETIAEILGILGVSEQLENIPNQQLKLFMAILEFYPIFYTNYQQVLDRRDRLEPQLKLSALKINLIIDENLAFIALKIHDKRLTEVDLKRFYAGTAFDLATIMSMTKQELEEQIKSLSGCEVTVEHIGNQYLFLPTVLISPKERESYTHDEILTFITFLSCYKPQLTIVNSEPLQTRATEITEQFLTSPSQGENEKAMIIAMLKAFSMAEELKRFSKQPPSQTFYQPREKSRKGKEATQINGYTF